MDGDAFLLLTKEHILQLVPAVGPQIKLLKKHAELIVSPGYIYSALAVTVYVYA